MRQAYRSGRFTNPYSPRRKCIMTAMKTIATIAGALTLAAGAHLAQAQSYGADINAETARKVAAATIAECKKNEWRMAVAVVDTHGTLVHFEKIDDTQHASVPIAIEKARGAANFRRPTRVFAEVINKGSPATGTLPGVIGSPGGVPIVVGGKIIGAVGVSGGTGDQDEQCAKVGVGGL
jgi:glc operon protein GlcG